MTAFDATLLVSGVMLALCLLAGIAELVDRRFLGGDARREAEARNMARRLR